MNNHGKLTAAQNASLPVDGGDRERNNENEDNKPKENQVNGSQIDAKKSYNPSPLSHLISQAAEDDKIKRKITTSLNSYEKNSPENIFHSLKKYKLLNNNKQTERTNFGNYCESMIELIEDTINQKQDELVRIEEDNRKKIMEI